MTSFLIGLFIYAFGIYMTFHWATSQNRSMISVLWIFFWVHMAIGFTEVWIKRKRGKR